MRNYTGQKKINGVYQAIINEIPICSDFYEVFCGSAQLSKILLSICPEINFHINDIDPAIIDRYGFTSAKCTNQHFLDFLLSIDIKDYNSSVFFLDPPYHHSTRVGNEKIYKFEMSDQDHIALFSYISSLPLKFILIHPKNCIYDNLLTLGWRYKEIKIRYNKKTSIERIYCNYEVPERLLTYRFLGDNFTQRQRILRKCNRFSQKLLLLPVLERNAVISHINSLFKF